jgi:hypothetical protein
MDVHANVMERREADPNVTSALGDSGAGGSSGGAVADGGGAYGTLGGAYGTDGAGA